MLDTSLRVACVAALLLTACAERKTSGTESPEGHGDRGGSSSSSTANAQCPSGGPSVAINVRGYAGGPELPREQLGALLGWIGGFARPCLEATPELPQFTLDLTIPEAGGTPTLELTDRERLPGLAACLEANFATAPAPPPEPMIVEITIPWGCPTLGPAAPTADSTPEPGPSGQSE